MAADWWLGAPPETVSWPVGALGRFGLTLGWLVVAGLAVPTTQAAIKGGISIAPVYSELSIKNSDTELPYQVTLSNYSEVEQAFSLSVVDFGSLDEEGGVAFLGQPISELQHRYGLASWVTLDQAQVKIAAGGSVEIKAHIHNRASLASGGHYGAVLATAVANHTPGNQPQVGVKQVLSSLILLTKEGGNLTGLALQSQKTNGSWWRLPTRIDQRFKNEGNIHVVPRGVVTVSDPLGRTVRRGALNAASGAVLPDSARRYTAPLDTVGAAWLPGRYRVMTDYRPDGIEATKRYVGYVWFAGTALVWGGGLSVLLVLGALAWWLWWRPRKRRLLP